MQRSMDELQTKMQQTYDEQKEAMRRAVTSQSEFEKQKALYEQKIEFINARCQQLETREKELVQELKDTKREVAN
jgi:chromosome segregation ATPase